MPTIQTPTMTPIVVMFLVELLLDSDANCTCCFGVDVLLGVMLVVNVSEGTVVGTGVGIYPSIRNVGTPDVVV